MSLQSSEDGSEGKEGVQMVMEVVSVKSLDEPPMEEWSSLIILELENRNEKRVAFEKGLYSPGSGELCYKYITMSDSEIFRHPYYKYPAVTDPGIVRALLDPEEEKTYDEDGQELYLELCKQMNHCPVQIFYKNLLTDKIDLKYYCVDPFNVRAMSKALYFNKTVRILDLTDNFLNNDSCFHLGKMLLKNTALQELILNGCRIGYEGAIRIFHSLPQNRTLTTLDLSRNQLGNTGARELAKTIEHGVAIQKLYLRYNNLSSLAAADLAEALESHNIFSHLDISGNCFYTPVVLSNLLNSFAESSYLQEIRMTNNSLYGQRIATAIKNLTKAPNLTVLDISHNTFSDEDIAIIITNLTKAKKLLTFNISSNPLTADCAIQVLSKLKFASVKIQNLFLDEIDVNQEFMILLGKIKNLKSKKDAVITYGRVLGTRISISRDPRDTVLKRAEFLAKKSKNKFDIGLIMMKCLKEKGKVQNEKVFVEYIKHSGVPLDTDLINEIINVFSSGAQSKKMKFINVENLVEYVKRIWPNTELPPTPPKSPLQTTPLPENESEVEPVETTPAPTAGKGN